MRGKQPSVTARGAAEHRAAHQTLECGIIFSDPFACRILGEDPQGIADRHAAEPGKRGMRLYIAARSRFAEDALAVAVARGVRQLVVLGAGYDTFGLRNPHAALGLEVFEVDHPDTQLWKRDRLSAMGISVPEWVWFVPVDFERERIVERLVASGLDAEQEVFFIWLGVVPYLTTEAVWDVLRSIAGLGAAEVVLDYPEPIGHLSPERRAWAEELMVKVASVGEPLITALEPAQLGQALAEIGFEEIEDVHVVPLITRYLGIGNFLAERGGAHLVRARISRRAK